MTEREVKILHRLIDLEEYPFTLASPDCEILRGVSYNQALNDVKKLITRLGKGDIPQEILEEI